MNIYLYKGDTGIGRIATLSNEKGNVDLTGSEVTFLFSKYSIVPQIKNAKNGELLVVFESIHTSSSGIYAGTFKVKFNDGRLETFPSAESQKIKIIIKEG